MQKNDRAKVGQLIKEAINIAEKRKGNRHYVSDLRRTNLLTLEAVLPTLDAKSKKRALRTIENLRGQMKRAS